MSWFRVVAVAVAVSAGLLGFGASGVLAQTPPTPAEVTINPVINVSSMVTALFTIGGAALVAAFGLGGGFRLAKKGYAWLMGKI